MSAPKVESLGYVSVSAGLALAGSCYAIIGQLLYFGNLITVLVAILCAALISSVISSAIAEMAGQFPASPGVRTYLRKAFGNGVSLTMTYLAIAAVIIVACIEVEILIRLFLPGLSSIGSLGVGILVISAVAVSNLCGLEISRKLQIALFGILTITSVSMSVWGVSQAFGDSTLLPHAGEALELRLGSLPALIGMAFFLFMGFEWVVSVGRNRDAYIRKIPWSMLLAIAALAIIYSVFALSYHLNLGAPKDSSLNPSHLYLSLELFPSYGRQIAAVVAILALLTTLNAGVMSVSRLIYIVARDGGFPQKVGSFATRISDQGTPQGAIVILWFATVALLVTAEWLDSTNELGQLCAAIYCLLYASFLFAFLKLRKINKKPTLYRSFVPIMFVVFLAVFMPLLGVAALFGSDDPIVPIAIFIGIIIACALTAFRSYLSAPTTITGSDK